MIVNYYELRGEKSYVYENPPRIEIAHSFHEHPLEIAIGIDPSSTKTGFTIGRVDMDFPFIGVEFERSKGEEPFEYIYKMTEYIVSCIVAVNNIDVKYIFTEDKYEGGKKYRRHTTELLSTVKTAMKSLPRKIKDLGQEKTPKYYTMRPSEWRKVYLGDLNTNKGRKVIKDVVKNFTVQKYQLHHNCIFYEDLMEAMGVYSAGFRRHIEPNLKDGKYALVDLNEIDWVHHLKSYKLITSNPQETLKSLIKPGSIVKDRVDRYGLKGFNYERGKSLEKNLRGLTTKSNAVFMTILDTWDMECLPIYYELGTTPATNNDKVLIVAYREIEKKL